MARSKRECAGGGRDGAARRMSGARRGPRGAGARRKGAEAVATPLASPGVTAEPLERRLLLATFTVTSVADSGIASLRLAITSANSNPGPDEIVYLLPTSQSTWIIPTSPLPAIIEAVTLRRHPSGGALRLSGDRAGADADGLVLEGSGIAIEGQYGGFIQIERFRNGIVSKGTGNAVVGCDIRWNRQAGIVATDPAIRLSQNRISGNAGMGIDLAGAGVTPNDADDSDGVTNFPTIVSARPYGSSGHGLVEGTFHGRPNSAVAIEAFATGLPDATGHGEGESYGFSVTVTTDANGDATFAGLFSQNDGFAAGSAVSATATYAGRTSEFGPAFVAPASPPPTVVHSAADSGPGSLRQVILDANATPGKEHILFDLQGGAIGLSSALPVVTGPVDIDGAFFNPWTPITISGPVGATTADGLVLAGGDSQLEKVALTGFRHGVVLSGPGGNTIGVPGAPVFVYRNTGDAVRVLSGEGNRLRDVTAGFNGGMGVDLGGDGRTPNDDGDLDAGPNGLMNAPDIASAVRSGDALVIGGSLRAAPGVYWLDFTAARMPDDGAAAPRVVRLGAVSVTVGASGVADVSASFAAGALLKGDLVTAVATDGSSNTGESSFPAAVSYPVFTVTSSADAGPGTLRQAILDANARPGADEVHFALPGNAGPILIDADLPAITGTLAVDGTTQPGYAGRPVVEVLSQAGVAGFDFSGAAPDSLLRGLAVGGFATGVSVSAPNMLVAGNYVGLRAGGAAFPNGTGLRVAAPGVRIGGTAPGDGNVISGNAGEGLRLDGPPYYGSATQRVEGNLIGTDPTGTAALPNDVGLHVTAEYATIGGSVAAARNVISGNTTCGLWQDHAPNSGSAHVVGNYIGTDSAGTRAVPNGVGAYVTGWDDVLGSWQGGEAPNVISGNLSHGVVFEGPGAALLGNIVGADAAGVSPLPNGGHGVLVKGGRATIGYYFGGSQLGNLIAFNAGAGVASELLAGMPVAVVGGNTIHSNGGPAIDLGADGPTANDAQDADLAAGYPNFPVLTSAAREATAGGAVGLRVRGTLRTTPGTTGWINLYTSPAPDRFGRGQAVRVLGQDSVAVDAAGNASFDLLLPADVPAGWVVGATANLGEGPWSWPSSTSEVSPAVVVDDGLAPAVVAASFAYDRGTPRLVFVFSEDVSASVGADDLRVGAAGPAPGAGPGSAPPVTVGYDRTAQAATFTFAAPPADGDWRAVLSAAGIADAAGRPPAADVSLDFWCLAGDVDRDRSVGFADLLRVAQNYDRTGAAYADGDIDGDATVGFADLLAVSQNYDHALPAGAVPMPLSAAPQAVPSAEARASAAAAAPSADPQSAVAPASPTALKGASAAVPRPLSATVDRVPLWRGESARRGPQRRSRTSRAADADGLAPSNVSEAGPAVVARSVRAAPARPTVFGVCRIAREVAGEPGPVLW